MKNTSVKTQINDKGTGEVPFCEPKQAHNEPQMRTFGPQRIFSGINVYQTELEEVQLLK